jgi:hypothetical protein
MKHTPGPWQLREGKSVHDVFGPMRDYVTGRHLTEGRQRRIASVWHEPVYGTGDPEVEYNALLIREAPAMAEILRRLAAYPEEFGTYSALSDEACDILARLRDPSI